MRRALDPDGVVFVEGELWQATVERAPDGALIDIPVGTAIAVVAVDGLRLIARPATAAETADAGVAILPLPGQSLPREVTSGAMSASAEGT